MPGPLEYVGDGDWNRVRSNTDTTARLLNPPVPQARVYNNANISIATSGARQFLTFNSERFDNGDLHSTTSNTGRLTAPITGLYEIGGHVVFASNATGYRELSVRINGTTFIDFDHRAAVNGEDTGCNISTRWQMTAGDYAELGALQTSGGALNARFVASYTPEFWMVRLAGYVNQGV